MRKTFLAISAFVAISFGVSAQNPPVTVPQPPDTSFFSLPEVITDEYIDAASLSYDEPINNYLMIGVHGGMALTKSDFNPTRDTKFTAHYPVYGASIILHGMLFGFMPYFALEFGGQHTFEGYEFKENKVTHRKASVEGAYAAVMEVAEVNTMMNFHYDFTEHSKIIAKAGIYGGYRLNIERSGEYVSDEIRYSFLDTDRRWTYGFEGGAGLGFMFKPFEFHIGALVKWSWASFYEPDYFSKYYYRFAYPLDIMVMGGLYLHLTPRRGHTRHQLKKMAKDIVYGEY